MPDSTVRVPPIQVPITADAMSVDWHRYFAQQAELFAALQQQMQAQAERIDALENP